jgi:prepilin-type N-terminal cleavage/methylation domain-containing protein
MKLPVFNKKGFTLIELLVVIGILAILLAITLIAINPARQFAQANNTKRRSDINALLNAVHQYAADHRGVLPAGITNTARNISNTEANICGELITTYMAALPSDPQAVNGGVNINAGTGADTCSGTYDTEYSIMQSALDNRVTVSTTHIEAPETSYISVTR